MPIINILTLLIDSTSSTTATNESSSALTPKQQERLKFQLQNDVDEIKNEFAQLQTKIRSSLKKKSVTAKDVATHVIGFGVDEISQEILIKQESLEKIFIVLANECWSFLDCDLLNSILEAYGTKNDRKRMTKYQKKLKEFCKRRVSELPSKVLPLHSSSESQSQILQRDVLIIKWNHNESDPKLQDISLVKRKMCKILSLDSATVDILDIGEGCVKITFSIFKGVSQRLLNKPLSEKQCDAFQIASVISLSCGDYQEIFTVSL